MGDMEDPSQDKGEVGERRGEGLRALMGAFDGIDIPPDLAARHDDYLYGDVQTNEAPA